MIELLPKRKDDGRSNPYRLVILIGVLYVAAVWVIVRFMA